jgi:hypothetical protein
LIATTPLNLCRTTIKYLKVETAAAETKTAEAEATTAEAKTTAAGEQILEEIIGVIIIGAEEELVHELVTAEANTVAAEHVLEEIIGVIIGGVVEQELVHEGVAAERGANEAAVEGRAELAVGGAAHELELVGNLEALAQRGAVHTRPEEGGVAGLLVQELHLVASGDGRAERQSGAKDVVRQAGAGEGGAEKAGGHQRVHDLFVCK